MADNSAEKVTTATTKPEQSAQPAQADISSEEATANAAASAMANEPEMTPELAAKYAKDAKEIDEFFAAESKTASQDEEIARIKAAFKANAYDILDLQPGAPESDIKKQYRKKSLLIHPDKNAHNPNAADAFDRLAYGYKILLDEKERQKLDEAYDDGRYILMKERKLTADSEEVKDPDTEFMKAWKEKVIFVLLDNETTKQRRLQAQMREEGREQRKMEAEAEERKRKREAQSEWDAGQEDRVSDWRAFQAKGGGRSGVKKVKKADKGDGAVGVGEDGVDGEKKAKKEKKPKKLKVLG